MINHVTDLGGYLSSLWRKEWSLAGHLSSEEFYIEDLDPSPFLEDSDTCADLRTAVAGQPMLVCDSDGQDG